MQRRDNDGVWPPPITYPDSESKPPAQPTERSRLARSLGYVFEVLAGLGVAAPLSIVSVFLAASLPVKLSFKAVLDLGFCFAFAASIVLVVISLFHRKKWLAASIACGLACLFLLGCNLMILEL